MLRSTALIRYLHIYIDESMRACVCICDDENNLKIERRDETMEREENEEEKNNKPTLHLFGRDK